MHPFVGLIPYPYAFEVNPGEIATLIEVPLICGSPKTAVRASAVLRGGSMRFYYFDYQEFTIWGITGHLLQLFF